MIKTLRNVFLTGVFAVTLIFSPIGASHAHAEITQEDIREQQVVELKALVVVLHEHVTLLQLILVNKLEAHVAMLQAQVEAQTK